MSKSKIRQVLEIIDQMEEVLGLYGAVIYPMANDEQKEAIIHAVGKADDMIWDLRESLDK